MKILFRCCFKVKLFGVFLCLLSYSLQAQYVSLPDSNFVNWLNANGYSNCLSGNQFDTTCSTVLNTTYLNISYTRLSNLYGIQFFKNLDSLRCNDDTGLYLIPAVPAQLKLLECYNDSLAILPVLPDSLNWLACESNLLNILPTLPSTLTYLTCYNNLLDTLPPLPTGIQLFYCSGNRLNSLPALPDSLTILSCFGNKLNTLPALPGKLQILLCSGNFLQTLPQLPASLTDLDCNTNSLTALPVLPDSLNYLGCYHNQLAGLPALPAALTSLNCEYNNLTSLPDLPDSLYQLYCDNNPNLVCMPLINTIWDFEFYNTGITCVPDYGNVYISNPALNSFPLCDSSNNTHGCLMLNSVGNVQSAVGNEMRIKPNPADKYLYVEMGMQRDYQLLLFNVVGQLLDEKIINQTDIFNTNNLPGGVYFIKAIDKNSNSEIGVKKVVVAH